VCDSVTLGQFAEHRLETSRLQYFHIFKFSVNCCSRKVVVNLWSIQPTETRNGMIF
jgi:hypothetical protein